MTNDSLLKGFTGTTSEKFWFTLIIEIGKLPLEVLKTVFYRVTLPCSFPFLSEV
jgi:hypothetical protein